MTVGSALRRCAVRALAAGLYALVVLVGPALHHDLACHVKSPTHCTTCLVSVTAPGSEGSASLVAADRRDAGALGQRIAWAPVLRLTGPRAGRSPPA